MSTAPARILTADEDQPVRRFLADNLAADGCTVASAGSAKAAGVLLAQDRFDLVLVDVNGETLALLDRIRGGELDRVALDLPIFVLTSNTAEHHRIRLFERGPDEVQLKPYSYLELRLRVAAVLRRCGRSRAHRIRVGRLELDPRDHDAWVDGEPLYVPRPSSRCSACWPRHPVGRSPGPS
jgi:DNA-binding response OmpR family regulator